MSLLLKAQTLCCVLTFLSCTKRMNNPSSAADAAPPAPPPASASTPKPAAEPARFAGGIVTLGEYKEDKPEWGRREVYLAPFTIDAKASKGLTPDACQARGGRIATAAELEHALRAKLVERDPGRERTESVAIPRDSDALVNAEGVGFYPVILDGPEQILVVSAEEEKGLPARCVIPAAEPPAPTPKMLIRDAEPRRGRGPEWAKVTGFYAIGEPRAVPPLRLKRGTEVGVVHESGAWSFISEQPENHDAVGWVLTVDLGPVKKPAKAK